MPSSSASSPEPPARRVPAYASSSPIDDRAIDAPSLLDAVQELRDAGAEAIVINGVARVVAQTYFLDDDDAIRVGGLEVKRPFIDRGDR